MRGGFGGRNVYFKAVLAGVAGAGNPRRHAGDGSVLEPVIADGGEFHGRELFESAQRERTLDGDLCVTVARELDLGVELVGRADVLEIFFLVGGVDAKEEVIVSHLVHQDVVDEAAVLIEQPGILRLPDVEPRCRVGGDVINQANRLRPADLDFAHVADVEQAHGFAHGVVLVHEHRNTERAYPSRRNPPFWRPWTRVRHAAECASKPQIAPWKQPS